jgi:FAD/FMN-containing dehydrogenase
LIGAEGTLAFIAEAVLETVPEISVKYTGLLLSPGYPWRLRGDPCAA